MQLEIQFPTAEEPDLNVIFEKALREAVKKEPRPQFEASFYPYTGLSSTIRLREGRIYVRISDILRSSPPEILHALARILLAKLYRSKPSKEHERIYREYTLLPEVLEASDSSRRERGYKLTTSPQGKVYDLEELFALLNERYFEGRLERPVLSWSQQKTGRVLGHHDYVHEAIIVSRTLDDAAIPRFVVEYVLYHEMLHIKHPPRVAGNRTIYHSSQFRADERRFEQFDEALEWMEKLAKPVRRKRRKTRRSR